MGIYLATHSSSGNAKRFVRSWMIERYAYALNIEFSKVEYEVSEDSSFSYVHFSRSDMLYSDEEQTFSARGSGNIDAVLLQGHLWEKNTSGVIHNAKSVSCKMRQASPEAVRDSCSGEYSIVCFDGNKIAAFNDRLSIEHIYYAEIDGVIFISNRIRLIQEATQSKQVNYEALNWLITCTNMIGEETSDKRIRRLPQGASIVARGGRLFLHENPLFMYQHEQFDNVDEALNSGIQACTSNILNAMNRSGNKDYPIPLSGGKDSRAILAMLLNSSFDSPVKVLTNGHESHPDVIVAKEIAKHYGLDQVLTGAPKVNHQLAEVSDLSVVERFPRHVFQMDGMSGVWDCQGYKMPSNRLIFGGQVGEVYRGYTSSKYKTPSSLDEAAGFFHLRGCFDPEGMLKSDAKRQIEKKLRDRAVFYMDNGALLEDVPDLFYAVERIPNYVGTLRRNSSYSGRLITPLYTDELVKLAFYLGKEQRRIDRIHFEMIHRSSKWLTSHHFANDTWDTRLGGFANGTPLALEGVPMPNKRPDVPKLNWRYKLNESPEFRKILADVFLSYPNSDIWSYYDKQKILNILTSDRKMGLFGLLSFYGFVNAFFYSNNLEENTKIAIPKR